MAFAFNWVVPSDAAASATALDWTELKFEKDVIASLTPDTLKSGKFSSDFSAGNPALRKYDAKAMSLGFDHMKAFSSFEAGMMAKYGSDATWKARLLWAGQDKSVYGWSTDASAAVTFQIKGAATLVASTIAAAAVLTLF